jgi:O-antigen ligase
MAFSRTGWLSLPLALMAVILGLHRSGVPMREVLRRALAGALTAIVILAGVWSTDRPDVGGDLDLQFAFRFSQGWDLLADLTGFFSTSDEFADRFEPSEERADVWPEYLEMFRLHPVLGVGLGVGWQTNSIRQEPHNLVIELLAETGLLGMAAFLVLLGVVIKHGRGGVGGALLAITFLPSITQTVLFEPAWWFAAGLFLAGVDPGPDESRRLGSVVDRGAADRG